MTGQRIIYSNIFFTTTPCSSLFAFRNLVVDIFIKKFPDTFVERVSINGHEFADVHFSAKSEFLGFYSRILSSFFFGQAAEVLFHEPLCFGIIRR